MPALSTHPRAFTLIELMVVMVIILILAGLVIVAISSIIGSTRDDSTETRLEMLKGFMAAYANSENARAGGQGNTRAAALPSALQADIDGQPPNPPFYSTLHAGVSTASPPAFTDPPSPLTTPLAPPLPSPASPPYVVNDPTRYPEPFVDDRWTMEPAIARTQAVLRRLLAVPENQSAFNSLPEDAKTRPLPTANSLLAHIDTSEISPLDPALIVDGHGNPIIYIPPEGITDLKFKDGTWVQLANTDAGEPFRLVAVDGTGFWASAGPDGVFGFVRESPGEDGQWFTEDDVLTPGADDNVYSTPVMVEKRPPTP